MPINFLLYTQYRQCIGPVEYVIYYIRASVFSSILVSIQDHGIFQLSNSMGGGPNVKQKYCVTDY